MWSYSQLNSGQTTMVTWTFVTMNHSWMHSVTGLIRLAKDSWLWLIYRGQRKMMSSTWQTWPYTAPLGNLEVRIEELEALPSFSRLMFVIKSVSHWDLLNSRCDSSMNVFQYTSATILLLLYNLVNFTFYFCCWNKWLWTLLAIYQRLQIFAI